LAATFRINTSHWQNSCGSGMERVALDPNNMKKRIEDADSNLTRLEGDYWPRLGVFSKTYADINLMLIAAHVSSLASVTLSQVEAFFCILICRHHHFRE
jgi:hypothetical protein